VIAPESLARLAGEAASDEARARAEHLRSPSTRTAPSGRVRFAAVAIGLCVLLLVAVVLDAQLTGTQRLHIDPVAPVEETVPSPSAADELSVRAAGGLPMACTYRCVATPLADGRVLVVAGRSSAGDHLAAALYDPATATFAATGAPAHDHRGGAAVLLEDGRALVVGGVSVAASLFDPATATFSAVDADLSSLASNPAANSFAVHAFPIGDGRVLLLGHRDAAVLDPRSGTVEPAGRLLDARDHTRSAAVALADGRILVAGGGVDAVELFDPATGRSKSVGRPGRIVDGFTATRLHDGRVLLAGGTSRDWAAASAAEVYEPATERFRPTGSMSRSRSWHTATALGDGRVLVVGGRDAAGSAVARTAEVYDPATGRFTPAPDPLGDRLAATAVTLRDGSVLVFGRYAGDGGSAVEADAFTADLYVP
jgi:hypothetical protein